jgi:hypothetical protein
MKKILSLSIAVLVLGCSVSHKEVPNIPPRPNKFAFLDGEMIGALKFESASIFFWPDDVSEKELTRVMTTARINSKKIDGLSDKVDKLNKRKLILEDAFFGRTEHAGIGETVACIETWSANPDVDFDEVSKWKEVDPPPPSLTACKENQAQRQALTEETDQLVAQAKELIDELYRGIDKGYPLNPKNIISVNSLESYGVFASESQIELFFKEFDGHNQKAYDIYWDKEKKRMLRFKLNKLDKDGKETGAYYDFSLERAPNFIGRVRLTGKVFLYENGKAIREGAAKIDGFLAQE